MSWKKLVSLSLPQTSSRPLISNSSRKWFHKITSFNSWFCSSHEFTTSLLGNTWNCSTTFLKCSPRGIMGLFLMMCNCGSILIYLVEEEFVCLIFCLEYICVHQEVCEWYLGVKYKDICFKQGFFSCVLFFSASCPHDVYLQTITKQITKQTIQTKQHIYISPTKTDTSRFLSWPNSIGLNHCQKFIHTILLNFRFDDNTNWHGCKWCFWWWCRKARRCSMFVGSKWSSGKGWGDHSVVGRG